ncbi:PBSX family phage terminase large subunit [Corynebacterium phoceense]|uniref:PBSX family phage terminase large subunit n=1 Tax=Corynebacterium phoceense TaxID=1686286 RepID=UPI0018AB8835|nr:PBSX family phage terminase large subunit [Corynebacterium phoceense]MBF9011294.1 PBSX family phage terminase large subunit [Corynebacterium phoceense]
MFALSRGQIKAIQRSTHSLNLWYGSVSSGKTIAWLIMMLGEIKRAGPAGSLVIMGKSLDSIYQNVFEPLFSLPVFETAVPHIKYRRRQPTATIFGREVLIIGVNDVGAEGRIRGGTYQKVFYDELTLCPETVWDMIWSRMRAVGNPEPPRVFATTNPATPAHYLKTRFIDRHEATDTYAQLFTMDDNPGLSNEYRERTKASYSGIFYRRMILGEWAAAEGAVYETWDQDRMVQSRKPGEVVAVGIDYGTNHPSAGHALTITEDGLQLTHEWSPQVNNMGGRSRLTDKELADSLERWLATLPNQPRAIYADPAAASFHEELRRRGIRTAKADNHVVDGIRTVESLLTSGTLTIAPECKQLIQEIPGYRWDPKATERGKDAPVKEKDDYCDAMRYTVFSSRGYWFRHVENLRRTTATDRH